LVVCSYGSGDRALHGRLQALGGRSGFRETVAATLFGTPRIEEVVATVHGSPIVVVPLFMAKGVTYEALRDRLAGLSCSDRLAPSVAAYGWRELQRLGWRAEETGLLLVGHGSRRHPASGRATARLASEIGNLALFADTAAAFLEPGNTPPAMSHADFSRADEPRPTAGRSAPATGSMPWCWIRRRKAFAEIRDTMGWESKMPGAAVDREAGALAGADRVQRALDAFDRANAADPNLEIVDGEAIPKELIYGRRMSDWLARLCPKASEALRGGSAISLGGGTSSAITPNGPAKFWRTSGIPKT
jgi:hypothetical protein